MKKRFLLSVFTMSLLAVVFMSHSGGRANSQNQGSTNAPGEGFCQQCHSSGAFSPSVIAEVFHVSDLMTPVTTYLPDSIYLVQVTINATSGTPSGYGFQAVALRSSNDSSIDTWFEPSGNAQVSTASATGRQYAEHDGVSSSNTFTAKWVAPAASTGEIKFYVAGNAVNGNGNTGGDGTSGTVVTLGEGTPTSTFTARNLALNINIYPNPVQDILNISSKGSTNGDHEFVITTMNGQVVKNVVRNLNEGENYNRLDVADLPKGNYILSIQKDGKITAKKFLKF